MEQPKGDAPKLPDMVMCGDHPSFTKTELNAKPDIKMDEKDKEKVKDKIMSYAKITPTPSRTERSVERSMERSLERAVERAVERSVERGAERASEWRGAGAGAGAGAAGAMGAVGAALGVSEHVLRAADARRRVRSLEVVQRPDVEVVATGNRALMQVFPAAALGSFRWPPYLLCVWVLVLVLTHALHCLVSLLERALPALRKCSQFFRAWTEESWREQRDMNQRVYPAALACVTGLSYALYFTLYAVYAVVLWSIEPLCSDLDEKRSTADMATKVTNYDDDDSKTNSSLKP